MFRILTQIAMLVNTTATKPEQHRTSDK